MENPSRRQVLRSGTAMSIGAAGMIGLASGRRLAPDDRITARIYVSRHVYDHWGYKPGRVLESVATDAFATLGLRSDVKLVEEVPSWDVRDWKNKSTGEIKHKFEYDFIKGNSNTPNADSADVHHLIFDSSTNVTYPGVGARERKSRPGEPTGFSVGMGDYLRKADPNDPPRFAKKKKNKTDLGDHYIINMQEMGHGLGLCPGHKHDCGMTYGADMVSWDVPDGNGIYYTPIHPEKNGKTRAYNAAGHPTVISADKPLDPPAEWIYDPDVNNSNIGDFNHYQDAYFWDGPGSGNMLREQFPGAQK